MKVNIWIKQVFSFTIKLIWSIITFKKKRAKSYWEWLKLYFDKEQLKRNK